MSSFLQPGKRLRRNSSGSTVTSSSRAPSPPPHKQICMLPSPPLLSSTGTRSTTSTAPPESVVWRESQAGPRPLYCSGSSRTFSGISGFSKSSQKVSGTPPDLSFTDSSGHSWSPSSSSFQSSSGVTLLNSNVSKRRPSYLDLASSARSLQPRSTTPDYPPTPNFDTALSGYQPTPSGCEASTTLPAIPGYGSIRLTVTMDLPPPPAHYSQTQQQPKQSQPQQQQHYCPTPPTSSQPDPIPQPESTQIRPNTELETSLDFLSSTEIRQLLRLAVHKHPSFLQEITQEYALKAQAERSRVTNFLPYSNNVWHILNTKSKFLDPEKQGEMAGQAVADVAKDIREVVKEVRKESSAQTKKNALETLRKIGRSICLAPGVVGQEVRVSLGGDSGFVDGLMRVLACVVEEDWDEVARDGSLAEMERRFGQLDELRSFCGVFEGFGDVMGTLKKGGDEGEMETSV